MGTASLAAGALYRSGKAVAPSGEGRHQHTDEQAGFLDRRSEQPGTVRKLHQNLGWAIGDTSLALPITTGVFEPAGLTLRPEIAAIAMAGSSVLVAVNALALKRLRLPRTAGGDGQ